MFYSLCELTSLIHDGSFTFPGVKPIHFLSQDNLVKEKAFRVCAVRDGGLYNCAFAEGALGLQPALRPLAAFPTNPVVSERLWHQASAGG